jgi:fructose-1,6-bisphosphatase/inositol monophosphatase family enzyme
MPTILGISENTRDVDIAVERLARAGFEDAVYDEGIVSEEVGNVGPVCGSAGAARVNRHD